MAWQLTIGTAQVVQAVDLDGLSISDSGANSVGRLRATVHNPAGTVVLTGGGTVALTQDGTAVWTGTLVSRGYAPAYAKSHDVEIEAVDLSAWLDRAWVADETIAQYTTDQSAVQQLVTTYGSAAGLTAPTANVELTKDDVGPLTISSMTLREAISTVGETAVSVDASGVELTARSLPATAIWTGIAYNGSNKWVAASYGGTVVTSTDSFAWSTAATGIYASSLDYGNSVWVAGAGTTTFGSGTRATVYWSSSGTSWSSATLGTAWGAPYTEQVSSGTPLAYWRLNDASGSTAVATFGSRGTYVGSPTLGTSGALADDSTNTAVYFSGSGQYVKSAALSPASRDVSVELWFKAASTAQAAGLFHNGYYNGLNAETGAFGIWHGSGTASGSKLQMVHYTAGTSNFYDSGHTISDTNWHQYVFRHDEGGTPRNAHYVDGVQTGTAGPFNLSWDNNTGPTMLASRGTAGEFAWNGTLDEVAVYNSVLGSATILAHYQAGTAAYHGAPTYTAAAYGTAGWVMVGNDSTKGWVGKSTTGTASWSLTNSFTGSTFYDVTYANGTYVIAAGTALLYSTSGTAWSTATTSPAAMGTPAYGIGTNGTALVAVGSAGAIWYAGSATGTYTRQTAPGTATLESVTWWPSGSLWVAVGGSAVAYTSPNGTAWTAAETTTFNAMADVAAGGSAILAAGSAMIAGSLVANTATRQFYVDETGKLNYRASAGTAAPYAISETPNGTTTIAAEELELDYDESQIVNRVYVASAESGALYAAWVEDATSIATYGRREAQLVNELVDGPATAERYGRAYLATRKDPIARGRFVTTGKNGWKAGQLVTITSTALGLSGATYTITQVDTEFLVGTGLRRYTVSFGGLPRSLVQAIASGE